MINIKEFVSGIISVKPLSDYDCGEDTSMLLYREISENLYDSVISELRIIGAAEEQHSDVDNFSSYTFILDNHRIIVSFDSMSKELRVVSDFFSEKLNTIKKTAGKCPVRLWQFEVDHTLIDCGMCYIIQCTDYSFFVIDSAHLYSINDDIRLYDFLRKNTPDGMPVVISGWYLSHGHSDHVCKCMDFLSNYRDVTVKGLYYNFVPDNHFSADSWLFAERKHTLAFKAEAEKRTDIPKYKLHSGQYFYIDCLRFDVLCSHEDVYPQPLEDYNNSSLVVMMTVGEDKVCFPGDASAIESIILEKRFPDFLSCDIMQVAHHGHSGTSTRFYQLASAKVALFPVTQIKFDEEYPRIEANRVACDIAKHIYIASNGTVMFTFPLFDSEILIYPDETNESFEGVFNLWSYDYSDDFKKDHIEKFRCRNKYLKEKY